MEEASASAPRADRASAPRADRAVRRRVEEPQVQEHAPVPEAQTVENDEVPQVVVQVPVPQVQTVEKNEEPQVLEHAPVPQAQIVENDEVPQVVVQVPVPQAQTVDNVAVTQQEFMEVIGARFIPWPINRTSNPALGDDIHQAAPPVTPPPSPPRSPDSWDYDLNDDDAVLDSIFFMIHPTGSLRQAWTGYYGA